jgi:fumarate hydratase, class II
MFRIFDPGNQTAITTAMSQGHLDLNVFEPFIAHAVLQSIGLSADAAMSFSEHCIARICPKPLELWH